MQKHPVEAVSGPKVGEVVPEDASKKNVPYDDPVCIEADLAGGYQNRGHVVVEEGMMEEALTQACVNKLMKTGRCVDNPYAGAYSHGIQFTGQGICAHEEKMDSCGSRTEADEQV